MKSYSTGDSGTCYFDQRTQIDGSLSGSWSLLGHAPTRSEALDSVFA